jgi:cyclophilin family peptidyl-prolyl cis-trans isomerase
MGKRLGVALAICFCLTRLAAAQVVRFETTAGNFDMVLNPTKDTRLQGYVDNFLHYINTDRYLGSWVTRAADNQNGGNFVLQMGGFFSQTKRTPMTSDSTRPLATYDPVVGVPAAGIGLSNTVGTVSLALPSNPNTNQVFRDAGTSSFFINAANNSFLDNDFTVFAKVSDMTVVNKIMNLQTQNLGNDPAFGDGGAFSEVPVQSDGFQVFIKRTFVVTDTLSALKAISDAQSVGPQSAVGLANTNIGTSLADTSVGEVPLVASAASQSSPGVSSLTVSNAVPEPATVVLALAGLIGAGFMTQRQRKD